MSVAWWILKENPDSFHRHSTFLSWAACGKVYNSSRNDPSAWNKVAFCMCVSEEVCKDQEVSQSSVFLFVWIQNRCNYEFWPFALFSHLEMYINEQALGALWYVLLISGCCCDLQRSHSGSGSAEAVWRSFPAVEWVTSSGNSIHTLSQGAAALSLPGIHWLNYVIIWKFGISNCFKRN